MDYYCTEKAIEKLKELSEPDLADYVDTYDAPSGHIIITDGYDTTYLTTKEDFQAESRLIEYDENFTTIEYFENGIPSWLMPKLGLPIYEADWTGDKWEFTKIAGI